MNTYTASRLTGGNRLFPCKVIIDDSAVTLRNPNLFSGKEKTILYKRISAVNIDCPIIGFSKIIIESTGEGKIEANGFTKREVTEMKELILSKM